jgi:anti-anti-sigma factor
MTMELPKLSGGVMSAEGKNDNGVVLVRFAGTADVEARSDLETFVKQLHIESVRVGATKVVVDFRELEFMNSSCFKIFVAWLAQVRDLAAEQQYRILLQSNPSFLWQRRSFAALSCFAADLVAIET